MSYLYYFCITIKLVTTLHIFFMEITKNLNRAADNIRILSAAMVEKAKSGHPGGAMGGADFTNALYAKYLVYDPDDTLWINRDRFFLDPGHMSPMLYSVLAFTGKFSMEELKSFRQWGSVTPGHPEADFARGIENTSGPLGQGHTMAVGAAIAIGLALWRAIAGFNLKYILVPGYAIALLLMIFSPDLFT